MQLRFNKRAPVVSRHARRDSRLGRIFNRRTCFSYAAFLTLHPLSDPPLTRSKESPHQSPPCDPSQLRRILPPPLLHQSQRQSQRSFPTRCPIHAQIPEGRLREQRIPVPPRTHSLLHILH